MAEFKIYKHNPPHLIMANAKYFITVSTFEGEPYLRLSSAKEKLYSSLQIEFTKHLWEIEDWVILDNHYHLMVNAPEDPTALPTIFKEVHRFTALWIKKKLRSLYNYMESINRVDGDLTGINIEDELTQLIQKDDLKRLKGKGGSTLINFRDELTRLIHSKKVFYNYWDTCITYENLYFTRLNYIWYNPVKHGYVDSPEQWKFGSYYYRFKGEEKELKELLKKYPFHDIKIRDDF